MTFEQIMQQGVYFVSDDIGFDVRYRTPRYWCPLWTPLRGTAFVIFDILS